MAATGDLPEEGEFVIGSVTRVENQGAYVALIEYPGQKGFVHIAEVASGWVKNIRNFIRENKTVVCKVLRVRAERGRIDLSLKQVSGYRKQEKIKAWKNEQKAGKLLEMVCQSAGLDPKTSLETLGKPLQETFGSLYGALEAAALDDDVLTKEGFEGPWIPLFTETAKANITPPTVSIEGYLELTCPGPTGITFLKQALATIEPISDEAQVEVQYAGAPRYRLAITAPDYKVAEAQLESTTNKLEETLADAGGSMTFERS